MYSISVLLAVHEALAIRSIIMPTIEHTSRSMPPACMMPVSKACVNDAAQSSCMHMLHGGISS